MQFKEWFYLQEQHDFGTLLLENFGQKRAQFIAQGANATEVDKYFDLFRIIKDKKYKQIRDEIPSLTVTGKDRIDITKYNNFEQVKNFVNYMAGQVDLEKEQATNVRISAKPKTSDNIATDVKTSGKTIFKNDVLEISRADTPRACVQYKGKVNYSWCVARNDSQNYYYTYRFKIQEPTFYFVKNKVKTQKETFAAENEFVDKWHFFIIQVLKGVNVENQEKKQYIITSAKNDGDTPASWSEILEKEPALSGKQGLFVHVPLMPEDREFYEKYKDGISDKDFKQLTYQQKSKFMDVYVRMDQRLTYEQFAALPQELKNKYIGFATGLPDKEYNLIKSDRKLLARYIDVTKEKIKNLINRSLDWELTDSEIKILESNLDIIDWEIVSTKFLLDNSFDKQEMVKLIIQNKTKLDDNDVIRLLDHADNKQEIAELIIQKNLDRSDGIVSRLLDVATDKQEIAKLIIQKNPDRSDGIVSRLLDVATDKQEIAKLIIQKKTELTSKNVSNLLLNATDKQEIAKLIIQKKTELTDDNVYNLLLNATDKQEIANILGSENINKLTDDNVYNLLLNATDKQEIANILGSENINKLSDDDVGKLLHDVTNKQEMAKLIIQYKTELSDSDVFVLLLNATDKQEIANILGSEKNINKLSDESVSFLLYISTDPQEIAKLIIQNKTELTGSNVSDLLLHATDKQEIANILGSENINKLHGEHVYELLRLSTDKQEIAEAILKKLTSASKLSPNTIEELEKIAKGET